MTVSATFLPSLERSKPLRFFTVFLFYITQGFPLGLFFYAIPAWMASNGASTAEVALVVGLSNLPWTLKLINGFLMDRYTYLPMGRRRVWLLGAQGALVLALVAGAMFSPGARDVFLISALGFTINAAVTFQDVAIDGIVVDILSDDERARAGGIMFGAQGLGRAAGIAMSGWLIAWSGISAAYFGMAAVLVIAFVYGLCIRERDGERALPWTKGEAHPRNLGIQVVAWWPLLKSSFRALFVLSSLLFMPILLMRSIPTGGFEAYWPIMATDLGEWTTTDYTNTIATMELAIAVFGLLIGGWAVDRIGPRRALIGILVLYAAGCVGMTVLRPYWGADWQLLLMIWYFNVCSILFAISMIPLAMSLCRPEVAATQFTLYMAIGNFGAPLGAALVAATAGNGNAVLWFWILAAILGSGLVLMLINRFPQGTRQVAEKLPQGSGIAPIQD
ncbi:MFS transporter [Tsuneonella sp. HG222]